MTDTQPSTTTTPSASNFRLAHALHYAEMGWAVVALHTPNGSNRCSCGKSDCGSVGKHPRWDEELQPHGARSATNDPDMIRRLWARWPGANVGIATGSISGITVCDIDPRNGGLDSLAALEAEHGPLPSTLTADTGGDGQHHIFNYQPGIKNDAGEMAPGIDFRNDGGLIVAAPSSTRERQALCLAQGRKAPRRHARLAGGAGDGEARASQSGGAGARQHAQRRGTH